MRKIPYDNPFTILKKYPLQVLVKPSKFFLQVNLDQDYTLHQEKYEHLKSNLTTRLYEMIFNDQCKVQGLPIKVGGKKQFKD